MTFLIKIYNERDALVDSLSVSDIVDLERFKENKLYRVLVTPTKSFFKALEKKVEINFKAGSFFFKGLKIDKVTIVDRFDAGNYVALSPNKIQWLRGKEFKYLYKVTFQNERSIMQLKEVLTSTGKRGQIKILVDWLCSKTGCTNLSLPCTENYCYSHCEKCQLYKDCNLWIVFKDIIHSNYSYLQLLNEIANIKNIIGHFDEITKKRIFSYRIYNNFLKTLKENGPLEAVRVTRFALVMEFLMEISPYLDNFLLKCDNDVGKITRHLMLDLCEWGTIKFLNPSNGFAATHVSTEHFAYGLFGTIERLWRQHPNVIIIDNMDNLQVCRSYYGGLFIQVKSDPDFWNWFQRLEAAIYKETRQEKSQKIGRRIYNEFSEEILQTIGKRIRIIDYGGGTGHVLATFLDLLLKKVPSDTQLDIRLIDLDRSSLDVANMIIPKVLEKRGFDGRLFHVLKADIFKSPVERAEIAIISQVLDLYTDLNPCILPREPWKFNSPLAIMLENVLKDKMVTTVEGGQRWTNTLGVAKNLLSIYYYMAAKVARLVAGDFDQNKQYILELEFESDKIRWVKEVTKYSQHTIIADRVIDAELLQGWGIPAKGTPEIGAQRFHLSKSSRD